MGLCSSAESKKSVEKPIETKETKTVSPPVVVVQTPAEVEVAAPPVVPQGGPIQESLSFWNSAAGVTAKIPSKKIRQVKQAVLAATFKAALDSDEALRAAVVMPQGEETNHWIATNTTEFYNAACLIYATSGRFCTVQSCPTMSGPKHDYLWKDDGKYKKPTKLPAPKYNEILLLWVEERLNNQAVIPDDGVTFSPDFLEHIKNIFRRLIRMYGHIYVAHTDDMRGIGANAHLNTCFKHIIYFILEFKLVSKDDLEPYRGLIEKFARDLLEEPKPKPIPA